MALRITRNAGKGSRIPRRRLGGGGAWRRGGAAGPRGRRPFGGFVILLYGRRAAASALAALELGHLRLADGGEQLLDDVLAALALGLGLEVGADAVPQHGDGHLADVVEGDAEPAVHGGHRLAAEDQVLPGPRTRPPVHHAAGELRRGRVLRPGGPHPPPAPATDP